ncbi:hypothetical protein QBC39DRAFT_256614 [Podospora conica]|nr:hypothetical protein QBC39DRAFT_256614 [Schizothecium conicum]
MLLQRSRRGGADPGGSSRSSNSNARPSSNRAPVLPPYEPPAHPLSNPARNAITEINGSREARRYDTHLAKSVDFIKEAVYAVNDLLQARRTDLANVVEKRQTKGTEKSDAEVALERDVARLEDEVATLTEQCEAAMRQTIDYRAELEDEKAVLELVQAAAAQQKAPVEKAPKPRRQKKERRTGVADDDEEEEEEEDEPEDEEMPDADAADEPIEGLPALLAAARQAKADEYAALSMQQRYAKNNEYIAFKQIWHDAVHQDQEVNLPHASTWFDAQGRPNMSSAAAGGGDDDDDDIVMEREVRSFRCELSLAPITEPYTSRVCNHTFQKSAVLEFMRSNNGRGHCPTCMPRRTLGADDFYDDDVYLRRMKRAMELAKRRQQAEDEEEEDEEDDNPDVSVIAGKTTNVKKERAPRRQNEEIEDE